MAELPKSRFFEARKIFDNVTLIAGLGGEQCYLIEGSEKALLIDALSGRSEERRVGKEC